MSVHDRAAATARRGIAKHGRPMVLLKPVPTGGSNFDPQAGKPIRTTVTGLQLEVSAEEVDGNTIQTHDRRYLLDGDETVTTDMQIEDSATYDIVHVKPIQPGTTRLLVEVLVRL